MLLNEYVEIKRGDMKSIKEMMHTCRSWLEKGASIMLFPEGTRSPDGQLQAFRDGAFKLAKDCNLELVPIVIDGTSELLPKGAKHLVFKKEIKAKVLPPINPAQFDSSGAMRTYVHEVMADTLSEMRGQPRRSALTERGAAAV
jgi:1-acyl-sn-glycerol-3-phosphate acyltransferase